MQTLKFLTFLNCFILKSTDMSKLYLKFFAFLFCFILRSTDMSKLNMLIRQQTIKESIVKILMV